jgi:hypothetical protein
VGTRGCALGLALGVLALTGCGSNGTASPPTITATAPATTGAPSPEGGQIVRALTLDQLRKLVLSAVRAESSVHLAMGNLNPPPSTEVDQDYSTQGGDLRVVVKLEPGSILMEGRRTGGEVYMSFDGKPFQHVPAQEMSKAEPTPLIALFRTDVAKDLTAIFAATVRADFTGADPSVGAGVSCYRLDVKTAEWFAAQGSDRALGVPQHAGLPRKMPGRLCIESTGLPVRLEVKYSEPLGGVAGTGTSRIDYSRWGKPVEVARP